MGTTFRYIFLKEERCWPANTYTMLKPIVQTVIIRVQFFRAEKFFPRKLRLKVRASDISHKLSVHFSRRGTVLAGQ